MNLFLKNMEWIKWDTYTETILCFFFHIVTHTITEGSGRRRFSSKSQIFIKSNVPNFLQTE